jgi:cytochrome c-type biogenesis protein
MSSEELLRRNKNPENPNKSNEIKYENVKDTDFIAVTSDNKKTSNSIKRNSAIRSRTFIRGCLFILGFSMVFVAWCFNNCYRFSFS